MKIKKIALVTLAVAALAQAGFLTWSYVNQPSLDGEDIPADFVCAAPGCGVEFSKTREELVALRQSSPEGVPCPACGKALTKRAVHCPSCQKLVPLVGHGRVPEKCAQCGKPISVDDKGIPFCPGG